MARQCLLWVDIHAGRVHQFRQPAGDEDAGDEILAEIGVAVGTAIPRRGGGYVLAAGDGFRLTDAGGIPDGLAVDAQGCLWIAMWGGGCVRRYSAAGDLLGIFPVPVSQPTCPGFGGRDLDQLYLTTAWLDMDDAQRAAEPLAGHLLRARPGVSGLPVARYAG